MFLPPSAPPAVFANRSIASVAQPSIAQKVAGSVDINRQESLLLSGLAAWQTAYTKATAATLSVPSASTGLFPAYGFLPPVPAQDAAWQYGVGTYAGLPAAYVCLSAANRPALQQAVVYGSRFYSQNYFVGGACGSTSNSGGDVLTLWLQLAPAAKKALQAAQSSGSATTPSGPNLPPGATIPPSSPPPVTPPGVPTGQKPQPTPAPSKPWWPWWFGQGKHQSHPDFW